VRPVVGFECPTSLQYAEIFPDSPGIALAR
jgi:hypothetical protein